MTTVLKTDDSALVLHDLPSDIIELIELCVNSVDAVLDVKPPIIVFGKPCRQQRNVGFFSNQAAAYNYSNTLTPSKEMNTELIQLLDYINTRFNGQYNGILINKYTGGEEYIGKHSDDVRTLDPDVGVIALSFGAIRKFRIRNKQNGKIEIDVPTDPTKIIQMAGKFQNEFTHEIPVEKTVKGVRYSLTFRKHV